ncbi:L-arabinose isomerase [Raineyella sp. LH-20]|uniref:L-arabinose isomerase n=1 Tax=Raineyella sp. LH-20 TaxID=3081204 RepID=UPI002954388A|nr:L-arabinose isomerase [Raineyella sp. LH-20]WOP17723.1 L-arabinose isomerase [Raineyella sp. LH-20]
MPGRSIIADLSTRKVWFLIGSQELYGEDVLRRVAEQSQAIVAQLNAAAEIPVEVVWMPVLKDTEGIVQAVREANADPEVIGVMTWMHTFSPAKMWIRGLRTLQKPLLHLHTQANIELPYADLDFDFMNLNQSAHGDREFGYILSRLGVQRKSVIGHASDQRVAAEIGAWSRAAAGLAALRGMKVARFGDNMRYVAVTEGDKTEAETVFGASINTWPVNDLIARVDAVSEERIDALVAEYDELYDVVPELGPDGDRRESLRVAAQQELGLRDFLEEGGFQAFTDSFEDLGTLRQLPGIGVQRLMADGYGFGAEGDWKTAILIHLAAVMGAGLPGGASLMEDYTYDLTPGDEVILGAHMLEVSPNLTTDRPTLEIHPLGIGGKEDPCRLVFTADPGPGVVVAMVDVRNRFRLIANAIDLVEPRAALPQLPVGRALWQPRPDFVTSAKAWLASGAAHHTVMSTALTPEVFVDFARMAGVEIALIDEHTTMPVFERTLHLESTFRGGPTPAGIA